MRVLITGGTGFIGSRLALRCLERGEHVRVLAKLNTAAERQNAEEIEGRGIEVAEGSVSDGQATRRACEGVDVVYHLAAAQHEANVPDKYYYEVNVDGTRNMLAAAVECGVDRFVHGSTIGVYGIGRDGPVGDDSPLEPDNIYGVTKLKGEKVVREYFDKMPIAIARISETYGPGDRRLLKLFKGIARDRFFMIGGGRNLHHPVYIDDLVDGLRASATSEAAVGKTYVLAGPRAITTNEMVEAICRALGKALPRLKVPLWPLMTMAVLMEGALRPAGIQPPLHRRRMNFFVKSFKFSGVEAKAAIDYQPQIDFFEGAALTADWYKHVHML
ncbi:MAG: NAD-dependent epimerase/dehydratase family protein [Gemmatimonadota bacterium]|nr:MAG: NAD-dependent epimerase/dehydratase family protein [Gemmatimonadota bacterium]